MLKLRCRALGSSRSDKVTVAGDGAEVEEEDEAA
jgi:hypothetical protein